MKASKVWNFIGTNIISLATVFLGLVVIALDQLNALPSSAVSSTILALLALIATSEIVERRRDLARVKEEIENISKQVMDAMQGVRALTFSSSDEAIDYLTERVKQASDSIDQAAIDRLRTGSIPARERFVQARRDLIASNRLKFRYVGVLYSERRLEQTREYALSQQLHRFFAGFYLKPSPEVPLVGFTIIDGEEVFTRYPFEVGQDTGYMAIRSRHVANLFRGYFERLWDSSQKLRDQDDYNQLSSRIRESSQQDHTE